MGPPGGPEPAQSCDLRKGLSSKTQWLFQAGLGTVIAISQARKLRLWFPYQLSVCMKLSSWLLSQNNSQFFLPCL